MLGRVVICNAFSTLKRLEAAGRSELSNPRELIERARALSAQYRADEAERLVLEALSRAPSDPDAHAELAAVYLLTQREFEAVEFLPKMRGAERFVEVAQKLADHFSCREQMARKLGIDDVKAAPMLSRVREASGVEPASVGVKLTACLIVKNESSHLARCLESVKSVADEIVVVDTGSTDDTVAIAERFGATIGHFEWNDDFAAARNASLALATGQWALWIDADEVLEPQSVNPIREALIRPQFGGYFIQIANLLDDEGDANQYMHMPVRLFQLHEGVHFEGRVHEQIVSNAGLQNASLEKALITHYGYRPSDMAAKNKIVRTVGLIERALEEDPEDAFQWFNLANAQMVARDHANAAASARACVKRISADSSFGAQVYQILAASLIEIGRPDEALDACREAEQRGFGGILSAFETAHALQRMGRNEEALEAVDACLAMEWPNDLTGDAGIRTHKRQLLKGQILAQFGKLPEALEMLDFALGFDPNNAVALYSKGATLEAMGDLETAYALFERCFDDPVMGGGCHKAAGRVLQTLGQTAQACEHFEVAWRDRPEDESRWALWARCAEQAGHADLASRAYEALAQRRPLSADHWVNWGRACQAQENHEGALQCYGEALKHDPANANAYFNCGDLLYRMGRFDEAAGLYETGLRHAPLNGEGWFVLGNCLAQLGILTGAVTAYRQTLALAPQHTSAVANLEVVEQALSESAA